ncbi:MAG TPA: hypothetical protein VGM05_18730 [Planctomycetaceae bacterium]|jgi:hypothetical protein
MNYLMTLFLASLIAFPIAADDKPAAKPADEQVEKERATLALDLCRKAAKEYRLCLDDGRRTELELKPEPFLKWSNPSVGSIHGGVFLWTHQGRPAAVASIFKWFDPRDEMAFEVQSLSAERLVGLLGTKDAWHSTRAGLEFKPVPESPPAPASTPNARLIQMRTISASFTADKTDRDDNSQQRMRLLTQPIFRYSSPKEDITDGALFAFVQGTDPEVFLQIEARETKSGTAWHYGLSRMNSTAFRVRYKDQDAWAVEVVPWGIVFNNREPYNILNLDHLYRPKK